MSNLNIDIFENEILSIVGVNGSGKSTLLKILSGELINDKGLFRMYGYQMPKERKELWKYISICP